MQLERYLSTSAITASAFAERIGVTDEAMRRYLKGGRIPTPRIMARIIEATGGEVTPNDFFAPSTEDAA